MNFVGYLEDFSSTTRKADELNDRFQMQLFYGTLI